MKPTLDGPAQPIPPHIAGFWQAFRAAVPGDHDAHFLEAFAFGDSQRMADELAALVLAGTKRATAASLPGLLAEGKRVPQAGDLSVVTDWAGQPLCVIRTTQVDIVPFDDISAEFAATEGEGDGSLAHWRSAHTAFFAREAAREGYVFDGRMPVCCERFRVIHPLPAPALER